MGMLDGMFLRSEFFINLYNKISGKHVYFAGLYVDKFLYSCVSSLGFYSAIIDMPVYYDNGAKLNYSGINSRILFSRSEVEVFLLFFNYFLKILFLVNFMLLNFFTRFVHVLSVGLGFRKRRRLRRGRRFFELYMGNRHRVSFELPRKFYVILIRRGNIIFFSNTKNKL